MTALEFAEWIAYGQLQPFGEARHDQRAGVIASAVVNVHQKKGATPISWRDFFPRYEDRTKSLNWRDLLSKVIGINSALGGKDKRKNAPAE